MVFDMQENTSATTTSVSFDQAADFYDQTRTLSEAMATHGIQVILDRAGPDASILEVGAGTGRIGVPLMQRGADWFGCDLSIEMMRKLRAKQPAARLAQADASRLPFLSDRFDALLAVHVLHLVGPWQAAVREFKRVLHSGGVFVNSWHWRDDAAMSRRLRDYWRKRVEAYGAGWRRPGIQERAELLRELESVGAQLEEIEIDRGLRSVTPREVVDDLAGRMYSDTWQIPQPVLETTVIELRDWATREYGDLDQAVPEEHRLLLDIARFA